MGLALLRSMNIDATDISKTGIVDLFKSVMELRPGPDNQYSKDFGSMLYEHISAFRIEKPNIHTERNPSHTKHEDKAIDSKRDTDNLPRQNDVAATTRKDHPEKQEIKRDKTDSEISVNDKDEREIETRSENDRKIDDNQVDKESSDKEHVKETETQEVNQNTHSDPENEETLIGVLSKVAEKGEISGSGDIDNGEETVEDLQIETAKLETEKGIDDKQIQEELTDNDQNVKETETEEANQNDQPEAESEEALSEVVENEETTLKVAENEETEQQAGADKSEEVIEDPEQEAVKSEIKDVDPIKDLDIAEKIKEIKEAAGDDAEAIEESEYLKMAEESNKAIEPETDGLDVMPEMNEEFEALVKVNGTKKDVPGATSSSRITISSDAEAGGTGLMNNANTAYEGTNGRGRMITPTALKESGFSEVLDKIVYVAKNNRLGVTLNHERFGRLNINLSLAKGMVNVQVNTSDTMIKEFVENNIQQILDSLSKDGVTVGGFSVALKNRDGRQERSHIIREGSEIEYEKVEKASYLENKGLVNVFA